MRRIANQRQPLRTGPGAGWVDRVNRPDRPGGTIRCRKPAESGVGPGKNLFQRCIVRILRPGIERYFARENGNEVDRGPATDRVGDEMKRRMHEGGHPVCLKRAVAGRQRLFDGKRRAPGNKAGETAAHRGANQAAQMRPYAIAGDQKRRVDFLAAPFRSTWSAHRHPYGTRLFRRRLW